MTFWAAVGTAVVGAGASAYGAKKNADAIGDGADQAAAVQGRALDASLALGRPTHRLGNSAQRQLASIFGLPDPGPIDFGRVDSSASGAPDVGIPGLTSGQQATAQDIQTIYQQVLGRSPDAEGFRFYANSGLTAQEIVEATRGSQEYQDKLVAGTLPESETQTAQPQQEFVGGSTTNPLTDLASVVANNPAYQFAQSQGEEAIARAAAARGINASGSTLKDLSRFNQGVTTQYTKDLVINPLFQLAGFGQQANTAAQSALSVTANNQSNLALTAADARGSAYQSGFNALSNLAGNVGNTLQERRSTANAFDPAGLVPYKGF